MVFSNNQQNVILFGISLNERNIDLFLRIFASLIDRCRSTDKLSPRRANRDTEPRLGGEEILYIHPNRSKVDSHHIRPIHRDVDFSQDAVAQKPLGHFELIQMDG